MTSKIGVKKIQYPNGTDILTLDSSGSLAIGNSATVGGTLGVTGTQTNNGNFVVSKAIPNVDIKDTGTAQASMDFLSNSDTVRATIGMERSAGGGLFVGSSAYSAVFGTASSGNTEFATNNNIRMTIDSVGLVTIPNQPAFAAYRDAGNTTTATDFIFNQVVFNIGNHYNSSNGRFTAPIAGRYQFNVMMSHNGANTGNVGFFRPQKNSGSQSWLFPIGPNIDHYSIGMSFVIDLAVNDYISVNTGTSAEMLGSGNIHNHFSGYFIG